MPEYFFNITNAFLDRESAIIFEKNTNFLLGKKQRRDEII
jgi:hypothetical protein